MAVAGCTALPQPLKTYSGSELPAHAVAQVAAEPQVFIACMDGVSLDRQFRGYDSGSRWPDRLSVLPGRHYLALVYSYPAGSRASWADIIVDVVPGGRYLARHRAEGQGVGMWVEDSAGASIQTALPRPSRIRPDPCP